LVRMEKALLSSGWERAITLIADRAFGLINADYSNANGIATAVLELVDLVSKIIYHPVDLFDHCLRKDFHFDPDFDRSYRPSRYQIAGIDDRSLAWYDFSECSITAAGCDSAALILHIQNSVLPIDRRFDQFRRPIDGDQVVVEVHRYEVPLTRITMLVDLIFKQPPEFRQ